MTPKNSPWSIVELQDICSVESGSTPKRSKEKYWKNGAICWATPTDITNDNSRTISETKDQVTLEGLESCSTTLLPPGSVLLTSRATIGEAKINTVPMCTNQGFKSLVPKDTIHNWYLYYQMIFLKNEYARYGKGSVFLEVNKSDSERFNIPLPPLPEQRSIADVLSTVDETIEQTRRLITKLKKVKKSMMQDLFTRGIGEDDKLRPKPEEAPELYRETEFGMIPKEWAYLPLDDILISAIGGGTPSRKKPEYWNGKIPWLTVKDFDEDTTYISSTEESITELGALKSSTKIISPGRLIYCTRISVGKSAINTVPMAINQDLKALEPREDISTIYLDYLLRFNYPNLYKFLGGSTVEGISLKDLMKFKVSIPTALAERKAIINKLEQISKAVSCHIKNVSKLEVIKKALMQDLLTGKVRTTNLIQNRVIAER